MPQCRHSPGTLATWLMDLKGNHIPLWAGEMIKWQIRELKRNGVRYFAAFGIHFMVRWIDYRCWVLAIQVLDGSEPAQAEFGLDSALYNPLKFARSMFSYLRLFPSFPWSVPETFPFPSFNIHHWLGRNGQPVSNERGVFSALHVSHIQWFQRRSRWSCLTQNTSAMLCTSMIQPNISSCGPIL